MTVDWQFLFFPISAVIVAGIGFLYTWIESRAFDRRWGRHHVPGE